jgi:hypothetical protein
MAIPPALLMASRPAEPWSSAPLSTMPMGGSSFPAARAARVRTDVQHHEHSRGQCRKIPDQLDERINAAARRADHDHVVSHENVRARIVRRCRCGRFTLDVQPCSKPAHQTMLIPCSTLSLLRRRPEA